MIFTSEILFLLTNFVQNKKDIRKIFLVSKAERN